MQEKSNANRHTQLEKQLAQNKKVLTTQMVAIFALALGLNQAEYSVEWVTLMWMLAVAIAMKMYSKNNSKVKLQNDELGREFRKAAGEDNINAMEYYLNKLGKGAIDCCDPETGLNALQMAVREDKVNAMTFLIKNGADLSKGNSEDKTIADTILERFLALEQYFRQMAQQNNIEELQKTLNLLGHDRIDCQGSKSGRTALHFAVSAKSLDAIKFLVARGADVNKQDGQNNTPIHDAIHTLLKTKTKNYKVLSALVFVEEQAFNLDALKFLASEPKFDHIAAPKDEDEAEALEEELNKFAYQLENLRFSYENNFTGPKKVVRSLNQKINPFLKGADNKTIMDLINEFKDKDYDFLTIKRGFEDIAKKIQLPEPCGNCSGTTPLSGA